MCLFLRWALWSMCLLFNYFKLDNTVYLLQRLKILLQSFFVSKLGQRSHTQRWRENRKSKPIQVGVSENNTENETSSGMSKAKNFKLGSKTRETIVIKLYLIKALKTIWKKSKRNGKENAQFHISEFCLASQDVEETIGCQH